MVNEQRDTIDRLFAASLGFKADENITWYSPLESDDYAEYQDEAFLDLVAVELKRKLLGSFWPRGGPVWDGLAKTNRGNVLLIEAKSHTTEMLSQCQAKSPQSLALIKASMSEVADYYGTGLTTSWLNDYYQYANRLAHLYLLRELNDIKVWLVFVYFVNDAKMHGPESVEKWQLAIGYVHGRLGIPQGKALPNVIDVFVDVKDMAGAE